MVRSTSIGIIALLLYACQETNRPVIESKDDKVSKIDGSKIYKENCLVCHYSKNSVDNDSTSLVKMARLDHSILLQKLQSINGSERHTNYLVSGKLTPAEIDALLAYIKGFWGPVP